MFTPRSGHFEKTPTPGKFYQVVSGDVPIRVARAAYGDEQKRTGLFAMNDSLWNSHVAKGSKGWEVYQIKGLQFVPQYDPNVPGSAAGSGRSFPVIWIPTRPGVEPEDVYKPTAPIHKPAPVRRPVHVVSPVIHHDEPKRPVRKPKNVISPVIHHDEPKKPVTPIGRYMHDRFLPKRPTHFSQYPRPGSFYQVVKGDAPIKIAAHAYGDGSRRQGLFLINLATWNDHVRRANKYWEAYGIPGLQLEQTFDPWEPRSYWNTGNNFPVLWITPITKEEPEEWFKPGPHGPKPGPHGPKPKPGPHGPKPKPGPHGPKPKPGPHGPKPGPAKSKGDLLGTLLGGLTIAGAAIASKEI